MKLLLLVAVVFVAVDGLSFDAARLLIANNNRRQASDKFVAFSAGLTSTVTIATNVTLVFDRVWTNAGNGYDNTTGIFTCPHTGVYTFIYHALSETAGQMWIDLYKNGVYQVTGYAHNAADYAAASNSVVLQLNVGDQVYLRARGNDQIYGQTDEVYGTFSGFILVPRQV